MATYSPHANGDVKRNVRPERRCWPKAATAVRLRPVRIGERTRAAREAKGWTLAELSKRAKYSRSALNELENQEKLPRIDRLRGVATALGMDIGVLVADDDEPFLAWLRNDLAVHPSTPERPVTGTIDHRCIVTTPDEDEGLPTDPYALSVVADWQAGPLRKADSLHVEPGRDPVDGDLVVASNEAGQARVARFGVFRDRQLLMPIVEHETVMDLAAGWRVSGVISRLIRTSLRGE